MSEGRGDRERAGSTAPHEVEPAKLQGACKPAAAPPLLQQWRTGRCCRCTIAAAATSSAVSMAAHVHAMGCCAQTASPARPQQQDASTRLPVYIACSVRHRVLLTSRQQI